MTELIKIEKSKRTGNPIVNARDLHAFLEAKQDFSNWLKRRIVRYDFIENIDYARIFFDINGKRIRLAQKSGTDSETLKRVHRIEYALTLDCAKELSMVQNNAKGKQARRYFIEKEKEFKALKEELVRRAEISYTMTETANLLGLSDYYGKVGRNALYNILYFNKIVNEKNRALKKYVEKGYFTNYPTRVTEEGLKWLQQRFGNGTSEEVKELKEMVEDLRSKQALMLGGLTSVVETLFFNKGGRKTEEQNRIAIEHLSGYLERVKNMPRALN
jgi:phage anti-repressor protein